jgi:hypothetical protein
MGTVSQDSGLRIDILTMYVMKFWSSSEINIVFFLTDWPHEPKTDNYHRKALISSKVISSSAPYENIKFNMNWERESDYSHGGCFFFLHKSMNGCWYQNWNQRGQQDTWCVTSGILWLMRWVTTAQHHTTLSRTKGAPVQSWKAPQSCWFLFLAFWQTF